jgi:hypothetical protein
MELWPTILGFSDLVSENSLKGSQQKSVEETMNELKKVSRTGVLEVVNENRVPLVRAGAAVVVVGVLALTAPIVGAALTAGAGFMALGVMVLIGFGVVQSLPLIGQKWENKLLAARKQEARENPEEQLDNRVISKKAKFKQAKDALAIILGYVRGLGRMISEEKTNDPEHDVSHLEKSLDSMQKFVLKKVGQLKAAEDNLAKFEKAVKRWKFENRFAEKGKVAIDSINAMEGGDATEELMTQEAIMAIEGKYDALFGEVDLEGLLVQASDLKQKNPELIEMDDNALKTIEIPEMTTVN